jgi:hypothetical protein
MKVSEQNRPDIWTWLAIISVILTVVVLLQSIFEPLQSLGSLISDPWAIITALATTVSAIGILAAKSQADTARRTLRAQFLLKVIDEWRDPEVYAAFKYFNRLREQWKDDLLKTHPDSFSPLSGARDQSYDSEDLFRNIPLDVWYQFAEKWVEKYATPDKANKLRDEWNYRRIASQFLEKMAFLIKKGDLTEDEFFTIVPETPRYLVTLIPIDAAVTEYWKKRESLKLDTWDIPLGKWDFHALDSRYLRWFDKSTMSHDTWHKRIVAGKKVQN